MSDVWNISLILDSLIWHVAEFRPYDIIFHLKVEVHSNRINPNASHIYLRTTGKPPYHLFLYSTIHTMRIWQGSFNRHRFREAFSQIVFLSIDIFVNTVWPRFVPISFPSLCLSKSNISNNTPQKTVSISLKMKKLVLHLRSTCNNRPSWTEASSSYKRERHSSRKVILTRMKEALTRKEQ